MCCVVPDHSCEVRGALLVAWYLEVVARVPHLIVPCLHDMLNRSTSKVNALSHLSACSLCDKKTLARSLVLCTLIRAFLGIYHALAAPLQRWHPMTLAVLIV
eukprot:CAMPEP_0168459744 /NCGR_PEP_ID=MMETSP0228-20121227/53082_1 /TAXON_ID=133427 /ORGANISM="Protoceratium reticulatum, Strain CCCM 535 (=CCMP 1889)" /LENGTH=101 /DNA_ID=CAMNT_0008474947 /DNA_START=468 /DNA_END=770 /DNA_ORIENTATION=-